MNRDPQLRAKAVRTKLKRKAQALGTTVERLEAPPLSRKERRPTLMALFREGKTLAEVVALHPRENFNIVHSCMMKVTVEWFNKTGLVGGPWDHLDILPLVQEDLL